MKTEKWKMENGNWKMGLSSIFYFLISFALAQPAQAQAVNPVIPPQTGPINPTLVQTQEVDLMTPALAPAAGVACQIIGGSGSTAYYYWVVATYPAGNAAPSGPAVVFGPPGLSAANYARCTWQLMPGAISYDFLRTTSSTSPTGTSAIAVATALLGNSYNDPGIATTSYTVNTLPATVTKLYPGFTGYGTTAAVVFNPRNWGAVGNGTTDDSAAFAATFTAACNAGGGWVYLPNATYLINYLQAINCNNVEITGQSKGGAVLLYGGANTSAALITFGSTQSVASPKVSNLTINCQSNCVPLLIENATDYKVDNVILENSSSAVLEFYNDTRGVTSGSTILNGSGTYGDGIYHYACAHCWTVNNFINSVSRIGIVGEGTTGTYTTDFHSIGNTVINATGATGGQNNGCIWTEHTTDGIITDNWCTNTYWGIVTGATGANAQTQFAYASNDFFAGSQVGIGYIFNGDATTSYTINGGLITSGSNTLTYGIYFGGGKSLQVNGFYCATATYTNASAGCVLVNSSSNADFISLHNLGKGTMTANGGYDLNFYSLNGNTLTTLALDGLYGPAAWTQTYTGTGTITQTVIGPTNQLNLTPGTSNYGTNFQGLGVDGATGNIQARSATAGAGFESRSTGNVIFGSTLGKATTMGGNFNFYCYQKNCSVAEGVETGESGGGHTHTHTFIGDYYSSAGQQVILNFNYAMGSVPGTSLAQIAANSTATGATTGGTITFYTLVPSGSMTQALQLDSSQRAWFASYVGPGSLATATSNTLCYNSSYFSGFDTLSTCSSLRSLKSNIRPLTSGLDELLKLTPVSYTSKTSGRAEAHFVAEDVAKIDPRCSTYYRGNLVGVSDGCLLAIAVEAIQEQQKQISALEKKRAQKKRGSWLKRLF